MLQTVTSSIFVRRSDAHFVWNDRASRLHCVMSAKVMAKNSCWPNLLGLLSAK